MPSGVGADSRIRATDRATSVATAVAKSVGEAQSFGNGLRDANNIPNRDQDQGPYTLALRGVTDLCTKTDWTSDHRHGHCQERARTRSRSNMRSDQEDPSSSRKSAMHPSKEDQNKLIVSQNDAEHQSHLGKVQEWTNRHLKNPGGERRPEDLSGRCVAGAHVVL